jgi:hypothetical protein
VERFTGLKVLNFSYCVWVQFFCDGRAFKTYCVDVIRFSLLLDALASQVNLYLLDMDDSVACKCRDFHEGYADVEHGPIARKNLAASTV